MSPKVYSDLPEILHNVRTTKTPEIMNYIEWCERVLTTLETEGHQNDYIRNHGIDEWRLEKLVWGAFYDEIKADLSNRQIQYVIEDAIFDLEKIGLIVDGTNSFHKLSLDGQASAKNIRLLWQEICRRECLPFLIPILKTINRLSAKEDDHFGRVEMIDEHTIRLEVQALGGDYSSLSDYDLAAALNELRRRRLIFCERGEYPDEARANYFGLVWERKRDLVIRDKEIDDLILEWETPCVDFKRELYLGNAGEKAEFIKDIIALANTQADDRRWLIIGIDDKTRELFEPPVIPDRGYWHTQLNQNKIEHILSSYVAPYIEVRYELIEYRKGKVGKIEVLRNPAKVPYRVIKSLGDKKDKSRIEANQIFVRHGSQTVQPAEEELDSLFEESGRERPSV